MSTTTTITKPAPILEGSLTAFLKSLDKLGAGAVPAGFAGIDTSKFAPQVADQVKLQTDAAARAAELGALTGPDAYKAYMSPYQQEVIDTTLAEFDRQQAIADTAMRDRAIASWSLWWWTRRCACSRGSKRSSDEQSKLTSTIISTRISTSATSSSG